MLGLCGHGRMLWNTLWELFEAGLGLGSGGKEIWEKEGRCLGSKLCERLGKLRWIVMKLAGVTQGSVVVRAEEFQGCWITRWW